MKIKRSNTSLALAFVLATTILAPGCLAGPGIAGHPDLLEVDAGPSATQCWAVFTSCSPNSLVLNDDLNKCNGKVANADERQALEELERHVWTECSIPENTAPCASISFDSRNCWDCRYKSALPGGAQEQRGKTCRGE